MKIHILAGGPASLVPELKVAEKNVLWIGVDRGVSELKRLGIRPDYAFGDFDSLPDAEKEQLETDANVFRFPPEKNETDLELAVDWALQQDPEQISVFGATGGRLDHEWANLHLLQKSLGQKPEMEVVDRQNRISVRAPGRYRMERDERYPYVSFLPLNESIKGLTLEGFKYPLHEMDVKSDSTLTVSNELITESGTYLFESGIVLVIRSRDF